MTANEFKVEYLPHKLKLYRVAFCLLKHSEDAEDAVQETYVKLWGIKDSLDAIRNSEAYCTTLVKNISLDMLRTRQRKGYSISIDEAVIPSKDSPAEQQMQAKYQLKVMMRWLETLPSVQRNVFVCRHQQGLSIKEIAQQLSLTEVNVKVILSRLRKELKEELNRYE